MGDLREAFDGTVVDSGLILPVDAALVEAGRKIADRVDEATATGVGQEVTKALYLLPHMVNILREMLATPAARRNAGLKEEERGKLAAVRDLRNRPAPSKKRAGA